MSRLPRHPVLLLLLLAAGACGGETSVGEDDAGDTISRETFIAAYVDLRMAALEDTASAPLTPARRARILEEHSITEDDLLRFAEVHGDRPAYIAGVWSEVEERIQRLRDPDGPETEA